MSQSQVFKDAKPPFSGQVDETNGLVSDVILRSSDLVDFHAHQVILSFVSPFFKNMFAFPAPPPGTADSNEFRDGKPVVRLPEESAAVEKLLMLCYPRTHGNYLFENLDGMDSAYLAVDKYLIPGAREVMIACLLGERSLSQDPYRVFAIACHRGLEDVAKAAAMACIGKTFPRSPVIPEFDLISAQKLLNLQNFLSDCCVAATRETQRYISPIDLQNMSLPPDEVDVPAFNSVWWEERGHEEGCGSQNDLKSFPDDDYPSAWPCQWFCRHMERVEKLIASRPLKSVAIEAVMDLTSSLESISKCKKCAQVAATDLGFVASELASKIDACNNSKLIRTTFC
ncbi:hypothetical protein B0H11DRAFT_1971305 [Mycena galericulata]|nr:hypothetical protein B0H11DRAFT_1971305 [Mycena galericulata]